MHKTAAAEGAVTAHHLPCTIDLDGPAKVSSYFLISEDPNNAAVQRTTFRGRRLVGSHVNLPPGAMAFSISPSEDEARDDEPSRSWVALPVSRITSWEHDVHAPPTKLIKDVGDWLHVARALHRPAEPGPAEQPES